MAGKVWLVGAGPSDGGLLTLKGKAVLEQAEVVVFDALVGPEILAWIPPQAEKINVGKRAGCHLKSQEEINRILLEKALEGRRVFCRLCLRFTFHAGFIVFGPRAALKAHRRTDQ